MIRTHLARWWLVAAIAMAGAPSGLRGQDESCRPFLDGPRLPFSGPDPGFRTGAQVLTAGCGSGLGGSIRLVPATALVRYRSGWAYDHNDGSLWTGRGLSVALAGGLGFERGPLRVVIDPTLALQQNRSFPTAGTSLRDPYEPIDWPQRLRDGAFASLAGGQSVVALSGGPAEVAASTENLWWGPARRYPILLGNSAPGFAHVRLGTRRPVNVGLGRLDAHVLWGRLDESPQFDTIQGNDHRLLTGFLVEFQPKLLTGLSLGIAGVQHNAWSNAKAKWLNLFTFPFNEEEYTEGNGLLSVIAHWRLEESDADFYLEWARDDYWVSINDLFAEPDRTQGYLLGFEKLVGPERAPFRLSWELVHLGNAGDILTQGFKGGVTGFYAHSTPSAQGHTHQGQLLGAAIGPSSNAQYFAIERLGPTRSLGIYAERIRRDDDAYYVLFAPTYQYTGYDIELTVGLKGEERRSAWTMEWEAALSRRKNRGFRGMEVENPYPWHFPVETNLAISARLFWIPSSAE